MELAVSDDLVQLFHALRFHIYDVVHLCGIIHVPEIYTKVICGQEVLAVGRKAQRVDVIFVSTAILLFATTFPTFINNF